MLYAPDFLLKRLLYRDGLLLIIDKPAGLPVHAGPGGGPNLERYLDALRFGLPQPPALAHRLDRDTSGCLVLGRHRKALARLGRLFAAGQVEKTYWAVVAGVMPAAEGLIELPLQKRSSQRGWWMKVDPAGQPAVTAYRVLGQAAGGGQGPATGEAPGSRWSWLELKPKTGRTHQIRVHCAALGCPLVGDPIYGKDPRRPEAAAAGEGQGGGLLLHARAIALALAPGKPPIAATAPVPPPLAAVLHRCGWPGEAPPVA